MFKMQCFLYRITQFNEIICNFLSYFLSNKVPIFFCQKVILKITKNFIETINLSYVIKISDSSLQPDFHITFNCINILLCFKNIFQTSQPHKKRNFNILIYENKLDITCQKIDVQLDFEHLFKPEKDVLLQPVHRNPLSELNSQPNQTRSQAAISSNRTVVQSKHRNPLTKLNPQPNQTRSQAAISSNRTVVQSKHRNPLTKLNPQPNQTQSQITLGSNNMTPKKRGRKRLPRDENEFFKFALEHIQRLSKNKSELSRLLLVQDLGFVLGVVGKGLRK
ncbi:hypothetical protein BpHYR1_004260 [Brachionus plicatilis]|uniref:Uncharacterized protein n=1 Tax=Brachionus plicatilis TaxID=10195 RepID=A0A3M7RTF8_BRAPC|nr:hypothetical protein BpHYR1_004260 [Brachionus plicatilis]